MAELRLTSPAFDHDADLPTRYRSEGDDISPPLAWSGVPAEAAELVVVAEDPDNEEGLFTHWLVYGIPPTVGELPENLGDETIIYEPGEMYQGLNEWGLAGYSGPATEEAPRRLFIRLSVLDTELVELPPGATRAELRAAAKEHVIATAELVGIVA